MKNLGVTSVDASSHEVGKSQMDSTQELSEAAEREEPNEETPSASATAFGVLHAFGAFAIATASVGLTASLGIWGIQKTMDVDDV